MNLDLSKKYILFFGFIRKYKGLDVLIQAMKDLGEDIHLIVAGEAYGSMEDYMQQINDFGLQNRVHLYTDYIADEQVKVFFSAADLCVLPYRSATQSGITAIAHHFCVPVIATNVGGLSEVISDGNDGIIVDQADAHLIANAIKKAYREGLIVKFRSQLKTKIDSNGWKKFAKAIIDFSDTL